MWGLKRFTADQSGTTAVIFGLALLPIMGLVGATLDYGEMSSERQTLQNAVDFTALAMSRDAPCAAPGDIERIAQKHFYGFYKSQRGVVIDNFEASKTGRSLTIKASATFKTSIGRLAGVDKVALAATASSAWGGRTVELALVLDNTGSMDDRVAGKRKMDELQKASQALLKILDESTCERDVVKVAIVPFDTQVRLATSHRDASWLRYDADVTKANWKGYIEDRDQPYDTDDRSAVAGLGPSLYPAAKQQWGSELAQLHPLVDIKSGYDAKTSGGSLAQTIKAMVPRGNTNITLGLAWGATALSNAQPLNEGSSAANVEKVIVLLTDGDNTQMRRNGTVVSGGANAAAIDDRTRLACENAKTKATVITIRVVAGKEALLRECASKPTDPKHAFYREGAPLYHDVKDPSKIDGVFREIAAQILGVRVTK